MIITMTKNNILILIFYCIFKMVLSRPNPLIKSQDFCMAEYGNCNYQQPFRKFANIQCQFGCMEKCSEFDNCHWWTWYDYSDECHLFEDCQFNSNVTDNCGCYTGQRCNTDQGETTPALVGGISTKVEVLMDRGPSIGEIEELPEERQFPAVASIGDKVFLCGGSDFEDNTKSTCYYYNFVRRNWTVMNKGLPEGSLSRAVGLAAYWDFYILGGESAKNGPTNYVQIMNGKTKIWRNGTSMPKPLAGHCAIRHLDAIYVIGSADAYLEVFKYNITRDDWKVLNPDLDHQDPQVMMPPLARQDFACALNDDKDAIFVTGGNLTHNGSVVSECFAFNISKSIWRPMASFISQPRARHIMTKFQNLTTIVGGINARGDALTTMESLRDDETWTILSYNLTNGRKNFGVTRVPTQLLPNT